MRYLACGHFKTIIKCLFTIDIFCADFKEYISSFYSCFSRPCCRWTSWLHHSNAGCEPERGQGPRDEAEVLCAAVTPDGERCGHARLEAAVRAVRGDRGDGHDRAQLRVAGGAHRGGNPHHGRVVLLGTAPERGPHTGAGSSRFTRVNALIVYSV